MDNEKEGQATTTEEYDAELDIQSDQFNPLKALTAKKVFNLPGRNARIYDNISQFGRALDIQRTTAAGGENLPSDQKKVEKHSNVKTSNRWSKDELAPTTRRFLPHQGMVQGKGKKARHKRNALLNMERLKHGPLGMLLKYKENQTRIKVHLRDESKIVGFVTGFVLVFDKHWNMVLSDVYEVWKRRKLHHCTTADNNNVDHTTSTADSDNICLARLRMLNIELAQPKVKSLNRKFAECSRRLPQIMIRGEQIGMITVDVQPTANVQ